MQIKIKDWNINYEVYGEGIPVIFLHGWLTDLETMRPMADALKDKFKVYLIDVVGFGKSDLPEQPLTSNDFGDFLAELVEKLEVKNPILIGHSNGGIIIINAVGRGLVKPRKVVLIDSAGIVPKHSMGYYAKVGFVKCGKFALNLLPNVSAIKGFKEKILNSVGSSDYKASPVVLKETMKIILGEDVKHLLPNIKAPTLLIWGTNDDATPLSDALTMEKLIPDAGLVKYVGGSHFAYLENIQNVNAVLNEFFKNDIQVEK